MTRLCVVLAAFALAGCGMDDAFPSPIGTDGNAPDRVVSPCRVNLDGGVDGADEGKAYLSCPDGGTDGGTDR